MTVKVELSETELRQAIFDYVHKKMPGLTATGVQFSRCEGTAEAVVSMQVKESDTNFDLGFRSFLTLTGWKSRSIVTDANP